MKRESSYRKKMNCVRNDHILERGAIGQTVSKYVKYVKWYGFSEMSQITAFHEMQIYSERRPATRFSFFLNERPLYSWLLLGKNAYLLEPLQRNYTKIFHDQLLSEISLHFYITIINTTDSLFLKARTHPRCTLNTWEISLYWLWLLKIWWLLKEPFVWVGNAKI